MAGGQNSTSPQWMQSLTPSGMEQGLMGILTGSAYAQNDPPFKRLGGTFDGTSFQPSAQRFMQSTQAQQPVTLGELLALMQRGGVV